MSIAHDVHEWLGLLNEGEEVTTPMVLDFVPEATAGAISSTLAAFSLCEPPLLELVGRRRISGGAMYVYRRTAVKTISRQFTRRGNHARGSGPGHKPHKYRGANLPLEKQENDHA